MEDIKRNRRSIKEIRDDMLKINDRKPTKEELIDLVKIINENSIPEDEKGKIKDMSTRGDKYSDNFRSELIS